jgi:protein LTV1
LYEEYSTEPKMFKSEVVIETSKQPDGGETFKYTMVNKPFNPKVGWNPKYPDLNIEEKYEDENGDTIEQYVEDDYYEDEEFEEGEFEEGEYDQEYDQEEEEEDELPILEEVGKEEVINLDEEEEEEKFQENRNLTYQQQLDREFDKFVHSYDDDEIGELEDKELAGEKRELDIEDYVKDLLDNPEYNLGRYFEDEERVVSKKEVEEFATTLGGISFKKGDNPYAKISKDEIIEWTIEAIRKQKEEEEEREGEPEEDILAPYLKEREEQWDCQSIVSTYSNTENHPKLLFEEDEKKKIKLSAKSGLPLNVLPSKPVVVKRKIVQKDLQLTRDKYESAEEKKARKKMVKENKQEKRKVKKATKSAFKQEEVKQAKMDAFPQQKQKIVVKY